MKTKARLTPLISDKVVSTAKKIIREKGSDPKGDRTKQRNLLGHKSKLTELNG